MLGECVGGCLGRLLIDISEATTYIAYTYCSSVVLTSVLSSRFHGDPSPLKVCNTHSRCTGLRMLPARSSAPVSHWRSISHFFRLDFSRFLLIFHCPPVDRLPDESSAYSSCFGTQVSGSGMRLTCSAQLSCDPSICASMLVVSACSRMQALVI